MEQKRGSLFKKFSIVYFLFIILYYSVFFLLNATNLEYRMWVWVLGNASLFFGLPLWLFAVWFRWHKRKNGNAALRAVVTVILAILFLLWSYFWFLEMLFSIQEEHSLFGGYVIVNRSNMLEETYYDLCKSKALFFREDADWNTGFEIEYLERKYRQEFVEVPFDETAMLFYDSSVGTVRSGDGMEYRTVPVSPAHPQLPINVVLSGTKLDDDYVELLTNWYIVEGCKELQIDREYGENKYFGICLYFSDREDIKKVAADVQKLMAYAMQEDAIYQDYAGRMRLLPEDAEDYECIGISFGKVNRGNGTESGYEEDVSVLEEAITGQYEQILEDRERRLEQEKEWEEMRKTENDETGETDSAQNGGVYEGESSGGNEVEKEENSGIDEKSSLTETDDNRISLYEKEARLICEKIRDTVDIGEEFSVEYNARGYEYYLLGEDGTYQYTLLYDRDSKNGECRLYVLYRSPYNAESGSYYYYTDTMTQIADVYAVVTETGEIIPSGKKAWSDVGNDEYREATGE